MEIPSSSSAVKCTDTKERLGFQVDFSWGVGSLRQCAGFPARFLDPQDQNCYFTPLGSLVVCWDVTTRQRKYSFQAHSDLITVMLYNSHLNATLTACYSGEIKLWSPNWELLLSCNATIGDVHFAGWSTNGKRIVLCGDSILSDSVVIVFDLVKQHEKWEIQERWTVSPKTHKLGTQSSCSSFQEKKGSGDLTETPESFINEGEPSSTYVEQKDFYDMAIFTSQNNVIALLQRHHNHFSEAHLFSETGIFLKSQALDPLGDSKASLMCLSPCHNGIVAVGFQGGIFLLLHEADLSIASFLQATGSAQVALWHENYLLAVSYLSGIFSWWTTGGELVHEIKGGPTNSIIHLNWAVPGRALWVGGIMSLHHLSLEYNNPGDQFPHFLKQDHDLKFLEVTGCGVAMNEKNLVMTGDFTGNIYIWQKGKTDPIFKTKHESSIRCLTWNNDYAFIGCLDGDLLRWLPNGDVPPCTALTCPGGILTMAWSHDCTSLAIGLDSGHLCLYMFQPINSSQPKELLNFRAHFSEREGQQVAAEIWSLCWSPCSSMIATASEDQTACVWNSSNGVKIKTLTGHTTAVTSIDWKEMANGQLLLATCADDRTVHLRDGVNFEMKHVFGTKDIPGWYTLTYLSLNPTKHWCLCSTQNGRLVLWDCLSGERLACRKMHAGSIEGLLWNNDYSLCATVSSDCVVNTFSVDEYNQNCDTKL